MDKRQHTRQSLDQKGWGAELIDQVTGEKLGQVVNLSSGGLMLLTERMLEIESLFQVVCNSLGPNGENVCFTAGVMVLWRSETGQAGNFWAGMQIIDIDADSWERLRALGAALAGEDQAESCLPAP